jgi:hypothetical protein
MFFILKLDLFLQVKHDNAKLEELATASALAALEEKIQRANVRLEAITADIEKKKQIKQKSSESSRKGKGASTSTSRNSVKGGSVISSRTGNTVADHDTSSVVINNVQGGKNCFINLCVAVSRLYIKLT